MFSTWFQAFTPYDGGDRLGPGRVGPGKIGCVTMDFDRHALDCYVLDLHR